MPVWQSRALEGMFNGLLSKIQTGGGTAKLRVVDVSQSPEVTVVEFNLTAPELIFPSPFIDKVYTSWPIIGTAVATALVVDCQLELIGRDGALLWDNINIDCGLLPNTNAIKATGGMVYFTSGNKYQISNVVFELPTSS